MTIVGGCVTAQDNIAPEELYHFLIKQEIESRFNCILNINIIRYDRFSDCFNKITSNLAKQPTDILLFHFRSEHFQRFIKFYYKYHNNYSKIIRSVNLLIFNVTKVEECDLLTRINPIPRTNKKSPGIIHRALSVANYLLGSMLGNIHFALKRYEKLVRQVIAFCQLNRIELILAGPGSRPHTTYDNYLAQIINHHMKNKFDNPSNTYIDLMGTHEDGKLLFFDDGTHVNERGHRRIAKLILQKINKFIPND
jgi:hypothetical protein